MKVKQYQPLTAVMRDKGGTDPPSCLGCVMIRHRDAPCLVCCTWRACRRMRLGEPEPSLEAYI